MNTPREIVHQLATAYGARMTLTQLQHATGKSPAKLGDYLDQLTLDGVLTLGIRAVYPGVPDGPSYQVWQLADFSPALTEARFVV